MSSNNDDPVPAGKPGSGTIAAINGTAGADLRLVGGTSAPISCSARPAPDPPDEPTPLIVSTPDRTMPGKHQMSGR